MKISCCSLLTSLAITLALVPSTWSDSEPSADIEYVSTEDLDQPFGDDDYTESHARIFPIVKYDREGEDSKVKVLHAPFVAVYKSEVDEGEQKTEFVDVPFFKLAQSKSNDEGEFDNKFIKLPIVGSLFRHKRQGDKEKIRFLIFSHTRTVDPDAYGQDDHESKRNDSRSRGKGAAQPRN